MKKAAFFLALFLILAFGMTSASAAYTKLAPIRLTRVQQNDNECGKITGSETCTVCSLATIVGYALGEYEGMCYDGQIRKVNYTQVQDVEWRYDPVWNLVFQTNGQSKKLGVDLYQRLPVKLRKEWFYDQASMMKHVYECLAQGSPVYVYSPSGPFPHASVVIGYNGNNAEKLDAAHFTMMEIKRDGGLWLNGTDYFNKTAAKPRTTYTSTANYTPAEYRYTCYVTLQSWMRDSGRTYDYTVYSIDPNDLASRNPSTHHVYEKLVITSSAANCDLRRFPYGASSLVRNIPIGTDVEVVAAVVNKYNNIWYRTADGAYVYSGLGITNGEVVQRSDAVAQFKKSTGTASINMKVEASYPEGYVNVLNGTITSTDSIRKVQMVLMGTGKGLTDKIVVRAGEYEPADMATRSINVADMASICDNLKVTDLSEGEYNLYVTVEYGTHGLKTEAKFPFTVGDGSDLPLQIHRAAVPGTYVIGSDFAWDAQGGFVSSSDVLKTVTVNIYDVGGLRYSETFKPNSYLFPLSELTAKKPFSKVTKAGNYAIFEILATDGAGNSIEAALNFNVVSSGTNTRTVYSRVAGEPKAVRTGTLGYNSYVVYEGTLSWQQAQAFAEKQGGHLATITSAEENAYVLSLLEGCTTTWIGAAYNNGAWQWVTGEPFTYTAWNSGQPSLTCGAENRVAMYATTGKWNDHIGSNAGYRNFVVEFDNTLGTPVKGILVTDLIYTFAIGDVFTPSITVMPINATDTSVTLTSSNAKIAKVEGDSITMLSPGSVTITVAANDGSGVKTSFTLTVAAPDTPPAILGMEANAISETDAAFSLTVDQSQLSSWTLHFGSSAGSLTESYTIDLTDATDDVLMTTYADLTGKQLAPGSMVYVKASCTNVGGLSAESGVTSFCTWPAMPDLVSAKAAGAAVLLNWEDSNSQHVRYDVYRRAANEAEYGLIATVADKVYLDAGLTPFADYQYMIQARVGEGLVLLSSCAGPVTVTTGSNATGLEAPEMTAISSHPLEAELTLGAKAGVTYRVYRTSDALEESVMMEIPAQTEDRMVTYTDTGLQPETTYAYRVQAVLGDECGEPGAVVKVTTIAPTSGEMEFFCTYDWYNDTDVQYFAEITPCLINASGIEVTHVDTGSVQKGEVRHPGLYTSGLEFQFSRLGVTFDATQDYDIRFWVKRWDGVVCKSDPVRFGGYGRQLPALQLDSLTSTNIAMSWTWEEELTACTLILENLDTHNTRVYELTPTKGKNTHAISSLNTAAHYRCYLMADRVFDDGSVHTIFSPSLFFQPPAVTAVTGFSSITATNVAANNARLVATVPGYYLSSCGFYLGTTSANLKKVTETVGGGYVKEISYYMNDAKQWYGALAADTVYCYKIWYTKTDGTTVTSPLRTFSTPPAAPAGISASREGATDHIYVTGSGKTSKVEIWRAVNGGSYALLTTLEGCDSFFIDVQHNGQAASYKARAVRYDAGCATTRYSAYTAEAKVAACMLPPSQVTAAFLPVQDAIRVNWTAVDGAEGYQVWRTNLRGDKVLVAQVGADVLTWLDESLTAEGSYLYSVCGVSQAVGAGFECTSSYIGYEPVYPAQIILSCGSSLVCQPGDVITLAVKQVLPENVDNWQQYGLGSTSSNTAVLTAGGLSFTALTEGLADFTVTLGTGERRISTTVRVVVSNSVSAKLPAALTRVEAEGFSGIGVKQVILPDAPGVQLASRAFASCSELTTVRMLRDDVTMAADAFPEGTTVLVREGSAAETKVRQMGLGWAYIQ